MRAGALGSSCFCVSSCASTIKGISTCHANSICRSSRCIRTDSAIAPVYATDTHFNRSMPLTANRSHKTPRKTSTHRMLLAVSYRSIDVSVGCSGQLQSLLERGNLALDAWEHSYCTTSINRKPTALSICDLVIRSAATDACTSGTQSTRLDETSAASAFGHLANRFIAEIIPGYFPWWINSISYPTPPDLSPEHHKTNANQWNNLSDRNENKEFA